MSIQLYEHCATYLFGLKPSEAVKNLNNLLGPMAIGCEAIDAIEVFDAFYHEAETCLIAGATADERASINVLGAMWVEYQRVHGYPEIASWRDEPTWYVEHPDTAQMVRRGWNGTEFIRK